MANRRSSMPNITFEGKNININAGDNLLQALIQAKTNPTYSCLAGQCHSCLLQAPSGIIPPQAQQGLSPQQCERNLLLACQCHPEHDLELQRPQARTKTDAMISGLRQLSPEVTELTLSPRTVFPYRPGQHTTIWRGPYLKRCYSLASVPEQETDLVFHIQHHPEGQFSTWIHQQAREGDLLQLGTAIGNCHYHPQYASRPLVLIGFGSGLGPLYGILRDAIEHQHRGNMALFHMAEEEQPHYLQSELNHLSEQYKLAYSRLVEGSNPTEAVNQHLKQCPVSPVIAYLCGPAAQVKACQRLLLNSGLVAEHIFTECFTDTQIQKDGQNI
ncbi:2Fe-2S iron-sulfur cluster binding domain-containing protein [Aestuariirhabdus sp. Z084]|uniref:2Fe-2S iron-sulfur cluster-binding protein n=1 Tax=Aestuariirhabdus haliotis TaxID=2918751 RepID=UPI00201B3B7F|nr:2Fe-2S iron-sulfur cluster binding domain-containing protein [Aestuariirhabdus haliotis]MCL6416079.1 2Fe-2S iron-sulfur cluster binding domain-containing protein [Aestuariirhabdus haliotis]MCL6419353.1 2Fe-2S iron-sulfur cluster binding domain-containing protein [Aestuariirhabdus haliotis]